jgi:hypothetical protein
MWPLSVAASGSIAGRQGVDGVAKPVNGHAFARGAFVQKPPCEVVEANARATVAPPDAAAAASTGEEATGARPDRRELNRMLGKLAPDDVVTVTRIDRLAA